MTTGDAETPPIVLPAVVTAGLDVALAGALSAAVVASRAGRGVGARLRPVATVVLWPPLVAEGLQPGRALRRVAARGARERVDARRELSALLDRLVPAVMDQVLRRADLTVVVQRYVDVDALVAQVDIEAVLDRLDLPEIIRSSTGAVSSEAVRQVRMRGIAADDAVGQVARRFRPRRRTPTVAPQGSPG
jgi:hypothetical protein